MKTGAGEYILGVTRPNGECLQNLVSNPANVTHIFKFSSENLVMDQDNDEALR